MRYRGEHKAETRENILRSAAREIRMKGPDNVAVAAVMAGAGLTHGGFYAHFKSKEGLVAEAIDTMFADAHRRNPALSEALADPDADMSAALRQYLTSYLSPAHRDTPGGGCPLPSLAADIARGPGAARERFASGLDRLNARIEFALARLDVADPRAEAAAVVTQMVGAVGLARAIGAGPQSDAILHDSLADLLQRLGL